MTRPAVFSDLPFEKAMEHARSEGKLLLVDATASWCGPCRIMDETTWTDARAIAAVGQRAIAIQLDVDASEDVARDLRIKAMPTVVALRDGAEIDRVTGLKTAPQLIAWLEALDRGATSLDTMRAGSSASPQDMQLRMDLARKLVDGGRLEEATSEYVWLWQHMLEHQPEMYGVRLSFLVNDLRELVAAHPPARQSFSRLRDAVAPPAAGAPDRDWFALNEVLGEKDAGLTWFDAVGGKLEQSDAVHALLVHVVGPMLIDAGRWSDLASLHPKPLATLAEAVARCDETEKFVAPSDRPEMAEHVRDFGRKNLRRTASHLVRALRAAGRVEEATAVAVEAREEDASREMASALADAER